MWVYASSTHIQSMLKWSKFGRHLTTPRTVVLCGQPNVGKSSLVNAMSGFQRAIVHDIAGTTRDVVSQALAINGWPVTVKDTAGLRNSDNPIEIQGIAQAKAEILNSDLTICVFDANEPRQSESAEIVTQTKRIGYPLTDSQIIRLIEGLPDNDIGKRWRFGIQLMAVYGLRPEDLREVYTKKNGEEIWTDYRKSKGGRK